MSRIGFIVTLVVCAAGCSDVEPESALAGAPLGDAVEPLDLEELYLPKASVPGLPDRFNRNQVMDDRFFEAADAVSAGSVQAFFENTPYGTRSWLADHRVDGKSAAEAVVAGARAEGINPIVMVARMQVEMGVVSRTSPPTQRRRDYAFGCGCPDNQPCDPAYRGLERQVACAAHTLRRWYDASRQGDGLWNRGVPRRTLDPLTVTPANHATASLYAYTPWVLEGSGGNWLVWNVTRRYAQHFSTLGSVALPPASDGGASAVQWIGDPCPAGTACDFGGGQGGVCAASMCTQPCEGYCPDRDGHPTTFCVDAVHFGRVGGLCTVRGDTCPEGFQSTLSPRFVGGSGATQRTAWACLPTAPEPPGAGPSCPPGTEQPSCDGDVVVRCADGQTLRRDCTLEGAICVDGACHEVRRAVPVEPDPPAAGDCTPACQGEVAQRCDGAEPTDCARIGQRCLVGEFGPACRPTQAPLQADSDDCETIGYDGYCSGNLAVWCNGRALYVVDCQYTGGACGWSDDGYGYWCR